MQASQLDEREIFSVAVKIKEPKAREKYLVQVCGENDVLFDRIRTLLKACEDNGSFLDGPPPGLDATIDVAAPTGLTDSWIGRYKVLQEIGEGGFGVVYMAEQVEPIRRKVALKVIKPGMDSREVLARFEAERQALALMDHSNIARVLDAGTTESGYPYFVMELVKGVPIDRYADDNNLSTSDRLKLFEGVCRAVQHAHQKGIIHRDIKPSNVLVTLHDGEPVPKVIDFGVAKALSQHLTDKTLFTRYGQVIGTPQYMSPEQAEMSGLDVDTRSDIYSLGVLAYELLVGRPPFEPEQLRKAGLDEMRDMIRNTELSAPSQMVRTLDLESASTIATHRSSSREKLCRELTGELDWITMRALEKDRRRRYETAGALADDVQRYLNDELVEARPPGLSYRLSKLIHRHRAALATCAAITLSMLVGLIIALVGWLQTHDALAGEKEAAQQLEEVRQEEEDAKNRALKLKEAADTQRKIAVTEAENARRTLDLVLAVLDRSGVDSATGREYTVTGALDHLVQRIEAGSALRPDTEAELHIGLAEAFLRSDQRERAARHYARAYELGQSAWDEGDDRLAHARRESAYLRDAIDGLKSAVELDRKTGDNVALAKSLTLLGSVAYDQHDIEVAEAALKEAVDLFPARARDFRFVELPHLILADVAERNGDLGRAASMREVGIVVAKRAFGVDDKAWYRMADELARDGHRAAVARACTVAKTCKCTANAQWFQDCARSNHWLTWGAADRNYALAVEAAKNEKNFQVWGFSLVMRSRLRYYSGDLQGAEHYALQAADIALKHDNLKPNVRPWALLELGHIQLGLGKQRKAEDAFRRFNELWDWNAFGESQEQLLAHQYVTRLLAGQSVDQEKIQSLLREDGWSSQFYNTDLFLTCYMMSDGFEVEGINALDYFEQTCRNRWAWEPLYPRREDYYLEMMTRNGDLKRAEDFFEEVLAKRSGDANFSPINPELAWTRKRLARVILLQGAEPQRAKTLLNEAVEILKQTPLVPQTRIDELQQMIAEAEMQEKGQ